MTTFAVGDFAWVPATSTQAKFSIPPELHFGSNRPAWLPVVIKRVEGESVVGTLEWEKAVDVKCKASQALRRDGNEQVHVDLSKLRYHNDAEVVHALGILFRDSKFISKVGKHFLLMNPGHKLINEVGHHHNSASDMLPYFNGEVGLPLSIYSIADIAYRRVSENLLNQTIITRGCSGSGKTEAAKHIIQYLIFAENPQKNLKSVDGPTYTPLGHAENPLIDMSKTRISRAVSAGITILDIFGSASSTRSPNSSRIIRNFSFSYSLEGRIRGFDIGYSMFDMSRIDMTKVEMISPYKIFLLLSLGIPRSDPRSAEFKIPSTVMEDLNQGLCENDTDFAADFSHLESLLQSVDVSPNYWKDIQCVLAAVLHLQRLNVSGSDAATISAATKNHVAHAEELLRLEKGTLGPALLKKCMDIGGQQTFKNLSQEDSKIAIMSLGSILYEKAFKFLLKHCSDYGTLDESMLSDEDKMVLGPSLRIVDFTGNENLDGVPNRLSQFLINVSEEKMNEHYLYRVFEREEQIFRSEGLTPPVAGTRTDCKPMAALLDEPPLSIINLLEEVTTMQRGSDKALFDKIFNTHSKGKLIKVAGRSAAQSCFIVKHTFGDTQYDLEGFLTANKVDASSDIKKLISNALEPMFPFLCSVASEGKESNKKDEPDAPSRASRGPSPLSKAKKRVLVANKARDSLNEVLQSINGSEVEGEADPLYLLCLKTNPGTKAIHYDPTFVAPQVKFLNISELGYFCSQSFAKFEAFRDVYDRYRLLFSKKFEGLPWKMPDNSDHKSLVNVLLQECAAMACRPDLLTDPKLAPVYGNTKLFLRDDLEDTLENLRSSVLLKYAKASILIQAVARARKDRKVISACKKGILRLQALHRMYTLHKLYKKKRTSATKIQGYYLMRRHSSKYKQMLHAVGIIKGRLMNKMIQRIRYKRLQRVTMAFQSLSRGFILRQHVNHMVRAALVLQSYARDFLKRLRRFYFRKVAVVRIQQVYRGSKCRDENRAAVKVLKRRKRQRIGTRAVVVLQSHWRSKMLSRRVDKIIQSARVLQGWAISRRKRYEFLKILSLTKWLQCTARRIIASNKAQRLQIKRMLEIETELLENARTDEVESLPYYLTSSEKLAQLSIGAGYSRNSSERYLRYVFGFDVSFDISNAYPNGWIKTVLAFRDHLTKFGKRRISHIVVGHCHTIIVDSSSNIYSFGLGDFGQLGRADRLNSSTPKLVEALRHTASNSKALSISNMSRSISEVVAVRSVCAGRDHTLVLTTDGQLFSWGGNRRGQLGHSNFKSSAIPRQVDGLKNVKSISSGSYHSCCLADPGIIYTWGARECLGRKAAGDECSARSLPFFSKRRVQALVSGDASIICRSGNKFFSWGSNTYGQLGISTSTDTHECDIDEAQLSESDENSDLNSTVESTSIRQQPRNDEQDGGKIFPTVVNISTGSWSEKDFFACKLVAGGRHVLLALYDRIWAWGWNAYGQLGTGSTVSIGHPCEVKWKQEGCNDKPTIRPHGRSHPKVSIAHVSAGWRSSIIMTKTGEIYAWGHPGLHGSYFANSQDSPEVSTDPSCVSSCHKPSTAASSVPIDPDCPLLLPKKILLPARLRDRELLGLSSFCSNAMSVCAVDILVKSPPSTSLNKTKYVSSRQAQPLKMEDNTTSEFIKLQREKLGSWSSSSKMKHQRSALKASFQLRSDKKEEMDDFDASAEWGPNGPPKSAESSLKHRNLELQRQQMEAERKAKQEHRHRREGSVSHEGLLQLFSPVKIGRGKPSIEQRAGESISVDYFGEESSVVSNDSASDSQDSDQDSDSFSLPSNLALPSNLPRGHNLSLTAMAQKRRSSMAAGRPTTSWQPSNKGLAPRRRASVVSSDSVQHLSSQGRRASVSVTPVSSSAEISSSSRGRVPPTRQKKKASLSSKELRDARAKFSSELEKLGNDIHRKKEPRRERFKPNSTAEEVDMKVRHLKSKKGRSVGNEAARSEDPSLSLVAVSDLATMIQSIKQESMNNMSNSWKF